MAPQLDEKSDVGSNLNNMRRSTIHSISSISSVASTTIENCLTRTEYECFGTGELKCLLWKMIKFLSGRKMSLTNRTIEHQDLHPKTAAQDKLFHSGQFLTFFSGQFYERICLVNRCIFLVQVKTFTQIWH